MVFLYLTFVAIMALTFCLVVVFTRPTQEQVKVQRRLAGLKTGLDKQEPEHSIEEYLARPASASFSWLEKFVAGIASAQHLRTLLLQADSSWSLGSLLFFSGALGVVGFCIVQITSSLTFIAAIVGICAAYIPCMALRFQRSRRVATFDKNLPDCIEMIVRALRAGYSIVAAINVAADQTVEPGKSEFAEVFKQQNYGLPLRDALLQMLERMPSADLRVLVTGIIVQKDTGGNLAELMERIAVVIRERVRIQGKIRTNTAQGRLTGWILCLLPIVMLVLMNLATPGYSDIMFRDELGKKLLYGGVALLCAGAFIIRQIIKGIEV
jgi:tight adherence protein B